MEFFIHEAIHCDCPGAGRSGHGLPRDAAATLGFHNPALGQLPDCALTQAA
jgi:hypothetical protein